MKKKLILFLCILLFAGCDATYNLTIVDNGVIESADFLYEKNDENKKIVDDYYDNNYMAFFDMDALKDRMYTKKMINGKNLGINLSYEYRNEQYQNSSLLDQCYYKKSFEKSDKYIIFYTEGGARCFYKDDNKLLDSLTVNIQTKLKVLDNNADEVSGTTYTWKFDDENFSSKDIYIKLERGNSNNNLFATVFALFIVILGIGFIMFLIYMRTKNSKNNKL